MKPLQKRDPGAKVLGADERPRSLAPRCEVPDPTEGSVVLPFAVVPINADPLSGVPLDRSHVPHRSDPPGIADSVDPLANAKPHALRRRRRRGPAIRPRDRVALRELVHLRWQRGRDPKEFVFCVGGSLRKAFSGQENAF